MRPPGAPVVPGSGLLVKQWYLDTFFEDLEELPNPDTDPEGFQRELDIIQDSAKVCVEEALDELRRKLRRRGIRVEAVER